MSQSLLRSIKCNARLLLLLLLSLQTLSSALTAAATPTTTADHSISTIYDGMLRSYWLHIPPSYNGTQPVPLVVALHGKGGTGSSFAVKSGLARKADQEGFIAVFPDALGSPSVWNHLPAVYPGQPDDTGFIRSVITSLKSQYNIDPRRIYVTGHSSGGAMAYLAGTELGGIVAAIAPVAGSIGISLRNGQEFTIPRPRTKMPVLILHGQLDQTIPYAGGQPDPNLPWKHLSVADATQFWVRNNGCRSVPQVEKLAGGNLRKDTYVECQGNADVVVYTFIMGDHSWPGAPANSTGISAADLIWDFFAEHTLPERSSLLGRIWQRLFGGKTQ